MIGIPELAVEVLRRHRERQEFERLAIGEQWKTSGHVFTTTVGTPIDPRNVNTIFNRLLAKAGIGKHRFHDQRHAFATFQLADGVPLRTVMERLGHTQIGTTIDIYGHVTRQMHREAADRLGAMFG